jgi:hypothetical protein
MAKTELMSQDPPSEPKRLVPESRENRRYASGTVNMAPPSPLSEEAVSGVPIMRGAWETRVITLIGMVIIAVGLVYFLFPKESKPLPTVREQDFPVIEQESDIKLEKKARDVLRNFLSARTLAEKEDFLLGSGIFRSEVGFPETFEVGLSEQQFAVSPYYPELRQQGIFALLYERPAALSMENYPKPILRQEVEIGLEAPGWLEMAGNSDFMAKSQPRICVMAFFKKEDGRLLLDWDLWKQSGSRALEIFSLTPDAPAEKFRVKISPMHPAPAAAFGKTDGRWFWIEDPCYDGVRYGVGAPLNIAKSILARPSLSKPEGSPSLAATMEIEWNRETDTMRIRKFVCWGFEGLLE